MRVSERIRLGKGVSISVSSGSGKSGQGCLFFLLVVTLIAAALVWLSIQAGIQ